MMNRSMTKGYQGSSGTSYQYDMNDPVDRVGYGVDTSAQQRDQDDSLF